MIWFWVILATGWLIFCTFLYRRNRFRLSDVNGYKLSGGDITPLDLSTLSYFPLLLLWVCAVYPAVAEQYGLGYLGLAFIPMFACIVFLTKRLWLLVARYGSIYELFGRYFQSSQIKRLFALISLFFSIMFIIAQARVAGIFLNVFSGGDLPAWLGISLAVILPAVYVVWGGLKGLLPFYRVQSLIMLLGILGLILMIVIRFSVWHLDDFTNLLISEVESVMFVAPVKEYSVLVDYLSFISLSLLLLAIPCLSIVWNAPGSAMRFLNHNSLGLSWLTIGLLVILVLPIIYVAMQALKINDYIEVQPSLNGPINIFYPSFTDSSKLLSLLILNITEHRWVSILIALSIFSSLLMAGSSYLAHTASTVSKNIIEPLGISMKKPRALLLLVGLITLVSWVLALIIDMPLLNIYSLALGIACQTLPAIIGITYCSFFTRSGINLGMLGGIITVILSDPFFFSQFNLQLPAMEYLLNVKSVLWGLAVNFVITIALSFITNDVDSIRHKKEFHNFLSGYAGLPRDKRHLKLPSWIACILWLIFALSPTVFVSVYDFNLLGGGSVLSLILGWQILWGLLGISLLWYLAKNVELAYYPYKSERVALRDSLLKKE